MNKVLLTGRLTANPNPVATSKNIPVTKFSVACNNSFNKSKTEFIPCTCFNQSATYANTYIKKGDFVVIEGHLSRSKFTNSQGNTSYTMDVIVETINLVNISTNNNFNLDSSMSTTGNLNKTESNKNDGISSSNEMPNTNSAFSSLAEANKKEQSASEQDDELPAWMNDLDD